MKFMKFVTIVSNGGANGYSIQRVNLPPEILADILSRLSVNSLSQLKCVSPSWNSLISFSYFAKTHLKQTSINNNPRQKIILVSESEDLYSVDFAGADPTAEKLDFHSVQHSPKWVKVLGSCNGLLLVYDQGYSKFLLNPTTRELKKLPTSPVLDLYSFRHGFGYDSSMDDYKVVMLLSPCITDSVTMNNVVVLVYSLKTDAWRRIQNSHYHPLGLEWYSVVHVDKRLHWLFRRTGVSDGSIIIVAFDLSDEIFREMQLPTSFSDYDIMFHHMAVLGVVSV